MLFYLIETVFRPSMRKVNKENQSKEEEECSTGKGDVVAPNHEEAIWDEE
jgi:hypothetical protein